MAKKKNEIKQQAQTFKSSIMAGNKSPVGIGNMEAYSVLFDSDEAPIEFTNFMKLGEEYPAFPYMGGPPFIMTTEWAESYAEGVNAKPRPLYIKGHEDAGVYKGRPVPSGYVVGAKVMKQDGVDVLAIRNMFKLATTEEDKSLINQTHKEIKAGMLSTSIGDIERQEWVYLSEPDDNGYDTYVRVTESIKGQSNAIVEEDLAASESDIIHTSFQQGVSPDENINEETNMDAELKKALAMVKNNFLSGTLTLEDMSTGIGIKVLTNADSERLTQLSTAEKTLGMGIEDHLKGLAEEKKATFSALKESTLSEVFKVKDVKETAEGLFSITSGSKEEIAEEVTRISELPAIKKIQATYAESGNIDLGGDSGSNTVIKSEYGQSMEA